MQRLDENEELVVRCRYEYFQNAVCVLKVLFFFYHFFGFFHVIFEITVRMAPKKTMGAEKPEIHNDHD